jgi:flagellar biosynthesis protein FlhF
LAWHGTPAKLNERLCLAAAVMQADDPTIALAGACDATFTFSPLALGPGSRIMLVGTVGAGKTVTCAKLAARAVLAGGNIQLITSDSVRAGAVGQIEAFAKLMGQSLVSVANPAEMTRAVAAADPRIPMVIDSPGTNVYAQGEIDDLRRFIDAAGAQPIVVMAAGADAAEAAEAAEIFASLGANRLVATRIDATRRFGAVLAAAYVGRMAFAELGVSPFIVEGLHDLNPVALARLLLADPALPRQRTAMAQAAQ